MNASRLRAVGPRLVPLGPVIATCALSLVLLRSQLSRVPYLNDSAVHEEMVRFALARIRTGHFPPGSWFPFLNLGSPQYLHYQSLGAMLVAFPAWVVGVGRAFTISTWLLVGCWPLCIYFAARLFGMRAGAAVAAAVISPFISSFSGVGYEQISYLWGGYGLWSQLFAMWTLPFAWALSWRAVDERRFVVPAAVLVAATAAFHFETGYLAFGALVVFVLVRPSGLLHRAGRALGVAGGAAALSAWAIVPLIAQGHWAAVNQFLQQGTSGADANSYGAGKVLSALFEGNILDWHHLPLISLLLAAGLVCCLIAWRKADGPGPVGQGAARALVLAFVMSLMLFFGRPTLGPLLDALPGARDLFLRRFITGVQLAGLFIAGIGAAQLATWAVSATRRARGSGAHARSPARAGEVVGAAMVGCIALAALIPAWSYLVGQSDREQAFVAAQSAARGDSAKLDALVGTIERAAGGGRTFAGDPSDWGTTFTVGEVPVFKYLASKDVDEVGFTLRTAALMSDPEVHFDESNPADYAAFGIRWLVLPAAMVPPVPAHLVERRGKYALWDLPGNGCVQIVDTRGSVAANTADLGSFSAAFLDGLPSSDAIYPTVAFSGGAAAPGTLGAGEHPSGPPGRVLSERADLNEGKVNVRVSLERRAVVLLSASYDPGWQVLVDGRPVATEMVAPALVGVRVGPGTHTLSFAYRGFPDYLQLLLVGAAGLALLIVTWGRRQAGVKG